MAVHILLGIIHDFALAACILSLGTGCGGWVSARNIYTGYNSFFKPALTVIHYVEMAAGYGYPYIGAVKGYQIAGGYGNKGKIGGVNVIPLSTSMVPGVVYGSGKLGLPVEAESFDYLCEKLGQSIFDWAKDNISLPGLSFIGGIVNSIFGGETIDDIVGKIIGGVLKFRYCNALGASGMPNGQNGLERQIGRGNDKISENNNDAAEDNRRNNRQPGDPGYRNPQTGPNQAGGRTPVGTRVGSWSYVVDPGFDKGWGDDGPYHTTVGNGDDQMQVWSININPTYTENTERRVKIASRDMTGTDLRQGGTIGYFAQAEFYYDCTEGWDADSCNNNENASYSIKWRGRLRRLQLPNFGSLLSQFGLDALMNTQGYNDIRDILTESNGLYDALATGPLSTLGVSVLRGYIDDLVSGVEDTVTGAITGALGTPTGLGGAYH